MSDVRPRVGVTRWEDVPGERLQYYWDRVTEAGGVVVDLGPDRGIEGFDALVLTGGLDIEPERYAPQRHPKVRRTDGARDDFELSALEDALNRDAPVLAICRGHQLLNVAFQGSLLQHIEDNSHRAHLDRDGQPSRWHNVTINEGSRLAGAYGVGTFEVNSRHHQAVTPETLAPGLVATAYAPDGLVEALESAQHGWVVAVQWHPERPEDEHPAFAPKARILFEALVRETRAVRS